MILDSIHFQFENLAYSIELITPPIPEPCGLNSKTPLIYDTCDSNTAGYVEIKLQIAVL